MTLITLGINHKTAPIAVREQMAITPDVRQECLLELLEQRSVREALLLSTCNRTEFYCDTDSAGDVREWLYQRCGIATGQLDKSLYSYQQEAMVRHAIRVSSGLDSMVLGEPQILGQMKEAYQFAESIGALGEQFPRLFQYIFSVTKQIRSTTAIGRCPVSVSYIALNLAKQIFNDLAETNILLIGSGETVSLLTRYLQKNTIGKVFVAARSQHKAQALADELHGEGILIKDITRHLPEVDMVISATSSPLPILGKGSIESALEQRQQKPMLLIDLASPRDIEPEIANLDAAHLYNLDDLQQCASEGMNKRKESAEHAEAMIDAHVEYFMTHLRSLDAVELIREYRDQADSYRDQCLAKALQSLDNGKSAQIILQQLAHSLTNKLTHQSCTGMRDAAKQGDLESLAIMRRLLNLNTHG